VKKILLSQDDYDKFIEFCNKEPDPETVEKLKKLLETPCPWEERELGADEEFVKKSDWDCTLLDGWDDLGEWEALDDED
jgi:hypothetical protein